MRKVKVDKETYLVLRALKVEENRQIPDILAEAVGNYAKTRKRRLAKLAKKLAKIVAPKTIEKEPETTEKEPLTEGDLQPEGGSEKTPE